MKSISEIDKNFQSQQIQKDNIKIYDIEESPFRLYGIFKPENETEFIRIPRKTAKDTSESVAMLNSHTSGGRVRFKTDSKYIALKCILPYINLMPHMPLTGSVGFDLFADGKYLKTFIPDIENLKEYYAHYNDKNYQMTLGYEDIIEFNDRKMRDIIINFPLYNAVNKVLLGMEDSAKVEAGNEYLHKIPVVFYGSSITQGGCVSKPGNLYASVLSRKYNFDFINLGFSGSALAEDTIAEYISNLEMSIFVYDYDHNAPSATHLKDTHYKMYKTVRDKHPDIPIIMASRPNMCIDEEHITERINIIKDTIKKAIAEGDKNVYFINGQDMLNSLDPNMMNVDTCHPNDFGSYCMAQAFGKIIEKLL